MRRKVRYEEMLPHEIVEARKACPVVYLPIGGIEWHGEHNWVGLDTLKAHALALRCAEAHGGLVMPPLFYGEPRDRGSSLLEADYNVEGKVTDKMQLPADSFAPGYMHTLSLEEHSRYVRLLLHLLFQMQSLGFRVVIIVAGHAPSLGPARAAIELYSLHGSCRAWAFIDYELVQDEFPGEIPGAGDHAATWETSLMSALHPGSVDLSRLPPPTSSEPLIGIYGRDPRLYASREYGDRAVAAILRRMEGKVRELLA